MLKENLSAIVVALALVGAAVIVRPAPSVTFDAVGYEGVMYRLNQKSGRIDVLVPTSEGAVMMPVGQISTPEKMSVEEKKQFSNYIKTVAQYLQIERSKSLGLKLPTPDNAAPAKS